MICQICGKELSKKEQVMAEINNNNICDSCWSLNHVKKINKEAYEENIKSIPACHRVNADLFMVLFNKIYNVEPDKAHLKNIIVKGKSGTLKTTTAYSYLKKVWGHFNHGKLVLFSEAINNVEMCCKYDGFLVLDDVFQTQTNREIFDIIENRLIKGYYTYITTNVMDFNYFGEKVAVRLAKHYLTVTSK